MSLTHGQTLSATVHDLAFGGEGVARVDNLVVFIPFTIPGEQVEAEVVKVTKNYARARLLRVVTPSPDRVTPRCPHFGTCGGCQYQHIDYARQVAFKRKQIADLLQRVGGFGAAVVGPVVPCSAPYHYRNRLLVRSWRSAADGRMMLGFLNTDSSDVVDVKECAIAEPEVNRQLAEARRHPPPKGGIRVLLRKMPADWDVARDSFFQNNFILLPELVATVRARLRDAGAVHLIDAYCGVGFFSLECADLVKSFLGVELDRQAIVSARRNQERRGITNGKFVAGEAENYLHGLLLRHPGEATTLLMDPPRTGCPAAALERVRKARPAQVIYVSCHPATLARDLKILCAGGAYELVSVTPHDMFPQTQHVECVADLRAVRS